MLAYNQLMLVKRILLVLLVGWFLSACERNSEMLLHFPVVTDSQTPQESADVPLTSDVSAAAQNRTLSATVEPYPLGTAEEISDPIDLGEAPVTLLPVPYPGGTVTKEPRPTAQPPATVEPTLERISTPTEAATPTAENAVPGAYGYRIINEYPHDPDSFTQGLVVDREPGILLEGSGLWGESSLRRVDLETGTPLQYFALPEEYFGEGITAVDDRIIQLTWKSGTGFVYDRESFELLSEFTYDHEGWGITHDSEKLIVSDGSATIHFWQLDTLEPLGRIQVYDENGPVSQLNELEYVEGEIWANVWHTDSIVRIDPQTGQVTGRIDLTGLLPAEDRLGTEDVLNGIAYDSESGRLFVTGKRWPKLFEIELVAQDGTG